LALAVLFVLQRPSFWSFLTVTFRVQLTLSFLRTGADRRQPNNALKPLRSSGRLSSTLCIINSAMINKEQNPVGWAMLMYELDDAKEHLNNLIAEIQNDPEYNEANLRVDLGHVYSHLNRAWHRRNNSEDVSEAEWVEASKFPNDLEPI
jgi:hypothetical protein